MLDIGDNTILVFTPRFFNSVDITSVYIKNKREVCLLKPKLYIAYIIISVMIIIKGNSFILSVIENDE